tara:strand:+ start:3093 stop:3731 length:639 start_codon:yes stop_codon:yes gene_type:complete
MPNFFLESVKDEPLTSLNDRSDLSRMAYQNKNSDIPLRNNSMTDRFESDNFINHKENFENNNSRINSLNEEIRELKEKLKSIYEKDELIMSLESECNTLKRDLDDFTKLKNEIKFIRDENEILKRKLKEINEKEELALSRKSDTDNEGCGEPVKEEQQIVIDILQLKRVLFARLKDYHEKHIDELIDQYDLTEKKEIDKSILEQILLKAIHV